MIKNRKLRIILALIVNVIIATMEILGLVRAFGEIKNPFIYYTEDSNIFLLITSLVTIVYCILILLDNNKKIPNLFTLIRYASCATVIETFLIVIFILGFTTQTNDKGQSGHYQLMFTGSMLYHHFLCPVVGCLSFLFLEGESDTRLTMKNTLFAMFPTLVYGVIIIILNIAKVVVGPYPFLHVYEQSVLMSFVWAIVVLGCAYGITVGIGVLYNLINKRKLVKENK